MHPTCSGDVWDPTDVISKKLAVGAGDSKRAAARGSGNSGGPLDNGEGDMETRPGRYMRLPEVLQVTGLSRSTIYRLEAQGLFPSRYAIGPKAVGWLDKELFDWVKSRRRPEQGGPQKRTRRPVRGAGEPESERLQ